MDDVEETFKRMLLVRPTDGYIYGLSVQAVVNKCLLPMDDLGILTAFTPVDGPLSIPGVMPHNDFFSLSTGPAPRPCCTTE